MSHRNRQGVPGDPFRIVLAPETELMVEELLAERRREATEEAGG